MESPRLLRLPEVENLVGLKRSAIYALIKEKHFPQPVPLGDRSVAFVESEVRGWITQRIEERVTALAARQRRLASHRLAA